jgi:hypothetical protein
MILHIIIGGIPDPIYKDFYSLVFQSVLNMKVCDSVPGFAFLTRLKGVQGNREANEVSGGFPCL